MKALKVKVENFIVELAKKYNLSKAILYGSRARGDNHERSDIDLAVEGGDVVNFILELDEEAPTLLMFDVVNLADNLSEDFLAEIERDGVILYEKI